MGAYRRYFIRRYKNKIIMVFTLITILFIGVGYSLIYDLLSIG